MSTPKREGSSPHLSPKSKPSHSQVTFNSATVDSDHHTAPTLDPKLKSDLKAMSMDIHTPSLGRQKADTNMSWGSPLGLSLRRPNDENLVIFRKAVGINWPTPTVDIASLEEGRKSASGIYRAVINAQKKKHIQHDILTTVVYCFYLSQIVVGAALTALGPAAASFTREITLLGAINTVVAGILALIKGSGQPQKLGKDQVGYRKLQDWIEETEALLAVGVIGRDRRDAGLLVEVAFKKYNATKSSEENNRPDMYINQPMESLQNRPSADSVHSGNKPPIAMQETGR